MAGFIQPLTVKMKLLFQSIWSAGYGWDDKIDDEMAKKWFSIVEEFRKVKTVVVPRCYCRTNPDNPIVKTELHGFSDSSEKCFAACIYFKFEKSNGEVQISLVTAKSRLVPKQKMSHQKKYTIPRLELMGNFLLSKLVVSVMEALTDEIQLDEIYCCSGSQVSLAWIRAHAKGKEFKTFVQNRLLEIRKNVAEEHWRYCKSKDNISDILTKDKKAVDFGAWIYGPEFLYSLDLHQKAEPPDYEYDTPRYFTDEIKEIKTSLHTTQNTDSTVGNIIDIKKYNDLSKLMRVTAFVIRYISNLKALVRKEALTLKKYALTSELNRAYHLWIIDNQRYLDDEKNSSVKLNLNLKADNVGVIRSYSRLKNSRVPFDMKAPIFINKNHKFAELLVYYFHTKCLHRGVKQTLNELRSKYWITQGRSYVKKLIRPCVACRKINVRPYTYPSTSDLPEARFDEKHPFSSIGIDYIGAIYCLPVYGNDQKKDYKAWIVLYTCMFTRAVSLEVVNDATAGMFINSFTRFISRRGCPNTVITDKGSVFTAAETQTFMSNRLVNWKFTLDGAPWQGGVWERLVGSVKRCIKKVVGVRTLSYVELQTIVAEVENILNNRPIDADYEDDFEDIITPNH